MKFIDFLNNGDENIIIKPDAETKTFGPWIGIVTNRGNEIFSQKNLGNFINDHVDDPSKGIEIPAERTFKNDEGFTLIRTGNSSNGAAKEFLG
ncbi:MAG: hypothetical protein GF383_15885 [Candidatus Lokiarchaeota archaeon]|nr:hypothetical protein [Candidatus Lokiarchaeota archaeon]